MKPFSLPYGQEILQFRLPSNVEVEVVEPVFTPAADDPHAVVKAALDAPCGGVSLEDFQGAKTAAIAISDVTRPVPHHKLLPPLLLRLAKLGFSPKDIQFFIASGIHTPMKESEYLAILPEEIVEQYRINCHDADDPDNLVHLGDTQRGTPMWINRGFVEADLRIVVGNLEPHQFQGFSGGVKCAAIGLAGRETIDMNHAMMIDPNSRMGSYEANPARQDVEEIGRMIGIHFALNSILNNEKRIIHALAGEPHAVMEAGIPLRLSLSCAPVPALFDLAIASAGGHPKDLNLYQSQKALSHASAAVRDGGTIILVAACSQGTGSTDYEAWMENMHSHEEVIKRFREEKFRMGPHKALQIAQVAVRKKVILHSEMDPNFVRSLLLAPSDGIQQTIDAALPDLPDSPRVGIFPNAPSTIPVIDSSDIVSR